MTALSSAKVKVSTPSQVGPTMLRVLDACGFGAAIVIWLVGYVVPVTLLLMGHLQAIPYGVYAQAGARWLAGQPLYETQTIDGFQYFPTAAWLFAPFAWLGAPLGDLTWRALSLALYGSGMWRNARRLTPAHPRACFFVGTCLAVGPAAASIGNGQANLIIGALSLHVAADLAAKSFWRAGLTLALGLACKPLMIVLALLAWAVYRPMLWRLPLALLVVFGAPWLLRDRAWLAQQYADCLIKLGMCATPDRLFEDLRGLLVATLGWEMPHSTYLAVRIGAAACVLACAWQTRAHVREPYASLLIAAWSVSYLMLFNPRTLSTSYTMPTACAALLAALYALQKRKWAALVLFAIVLSWTVNYRQLGFVKYWLKPVACLVFLVVLLRETFGWQTPRWQKRWPVIAPAQRQSSTPEP